MSDTISTTISTGVTSTGLTVSTGEFLLVSGTVISTIVSGGGTEDVQSATGNSGGAASFTTVSNGGFELISAGGTAISGTVSSGGFQNVSSGGTASFTTVSNGGSQSVISTGVVFSTTVFSGGFEVVSTGGTAISITVSNGGFQTVSAFGTAVLTTVGSGGTEDVLPDGTATSTFVDSSGTQKVENSGTANFAAVSGGGFEVVSAGGTATFTTVSSGGLEVLLGLDGVSGTAVSTTLDIGGAIDIAYLANTGVGSASVDTVTDMLTVSEGGVVYTQQLSGTYTSTEEFNPSFFSRAQCIRFRVTCRLQAIECPQQQRSSTPKPTQGLAHLGPYGGTAVELEGTLCFCIDTLIETPAGQVKVQDLAVGDLVMTRRGVVRPITWLGTGAVLATRGQRGAATPVIVHKGALADNVPTHDLRVTKGHSLYIDHVLIPVEFLVNHRSIEWDDRAREVKLFHIELETHDVLIANGAPAESYRDDGNRWLFRNTNDTWMEPPKQSYAPVLTGGALVDEVWRRLLDRAGSRPGLPLTEDADLHLMVDGQRLDAKSRHGETLVFRLLARPETVRVVSRSGAPQELGVARDPRELGVALWRIMLRQGPRLRMIEAEDAALAEGFHGYEAEHQLRWTDGDALLPAVLYDGLHGGFELELHVACSARYGVDLEARAAA